MAEIYCFLFLDPAFESNKGMLADDGCERTASDVHQKVTPTEGWNNQDQTLIPVV